MKFWNKRWLWTLIFFGLFIILSSVKVLVLPQGGSVTYFSLLILWLITYFFGFRYGAVISILAGVAMLGVNYVTKEYINFNIGALILEYPLGYGVFCLGGLITEPKDKKSNKVTYFGGRLIAEPFKLKMGYAIGVFLQLVMFVISAVLFYPPDRAGFWNNLGYCIAYDASYLLIEGVITIIFLCVPPVCETIFYLKYVATHEEEDDTLDCF